MKSLEDRRQRRLGISRSMSRVFNAKLFYRVELVECPKAYQSSCKEAWTPVRKKNFELFKTERKNIKEKNEYTR